MYVASPVHPRELCSVLPVQAMQGRYFASRRIQAHAWDGVTNYQVEETGEERARRQKQWETFLEEGSAAEDKESTNQTATT